MLHHYWRALEHTALATTTSFVFVLWRKLRRQRRRRIDSRDEDPAALLLKAVADIKLASGPSAVLDGSWPNVSPAPPPTMDAASLREGKASAFTDSRGSIYRFKVCCVVVAIAFLPFLFAACVHRRWAHHGGAN